VIRTVEGGRPAAHAATYRVALVCVLEQLQGTYTHVGEHMEKKNIFAGLENEGEGKL
jgi:hypothetical protein